MIRISFLSLIFLFLTAFPLSAASNQNSQDGQKGQDLPIFSDITGNDTQQTEVENAALPPESFSVVLKPRQEAVLSAQIDAQVEQIVKEFGQSFHKGDVLIKLDSSLYALNHKKAMAVAAKEQITFNTVAKLYKNKSRSVIELEEARLNLDKAKVELAFAKHKLACCTISAPYNGRIERLAVNEKEWVKAGEPLLKIVGDGTLLARALVPALYLPLFNKEREVEIILTGGKKVKGRVSHIGAVMDSASQTFEVDVEIANREGELISGMTGKIIQPGEADE